MRETTLYHASELDKDEWRQLQSISRQAFSDVLDRTGYEVDELVAWDDPAFFYESHVSPNSLVGTRYTADQSYSRPRVAVATDSGEPIGFAYSAHNVSGATERERDMKRLSIVKNYLWLREFAVKPAYQNRGIAHRLGKALLSDALALQPPVAYVWPDETAGLQAALESFGFGVTGEENAVVFGWGSTPVRQVRMQAPSVRGVLAKL